MKVVAKTLTGKTYEIEVEASDTWKDVRAKLQEQGLDVYWSRMVLPTHHHLSVLPEEGVLSEYGVEDGAVLHIMAGTLRGVYDMHNLGLADHPCATRDGTESK
eukprot:TRINITY_DN2901_c0_g1_i1.p1 TRINITY_DN2901_c0_g1~~TRINITY_DN2901_c0_g1_i1.p1  ORF type:complete len:103 (+),score=35.33 TRINITY_DN2901_c0_g1_i1:122-430(+)